MTVMITLTDKLLGRERRELKIVFALVVLTLSAVLLYPLGCVLFQSILAVVDHHERVELIGD